MNMLLYAKSFPLNLYPWKLIKWGDTIKNMKTKGWIIKIQIAEDEM